MIISLHTPKAGGSSFRKLLQRHYKMGLLEDYKDIPLNRSKEDRIKNVLKAQKQISRYKKYLLRVRNIRCIHGHFLPFKYGDFLGQGNTKFITWFRDPIERLGSHYFFWVRHKKDVITPPLYRKVIEEKWSLEKFCFSDELQNVYSQFLWNFPIENFDFIGITEFYEEDAKFFADSFLGKKDYEVKHINVNPSKPNLYFTDKGLIKELQQHHSEDYQLYEYALRKRSDRLQKQGLI